MIIASPCGCKTVPIEKESKVKEKILAGKIVWFDDPRCEEHEAGSGISGFMKFHEGIVYSRLFVQEEEMEAEFALDKAIDQVHAFYESGFEFSFGSADLESNEDGGYTLVCNG